LLDDFASIYTRFADNESFRVPWIVGRRRRSLSRALRKTTPFLSTLFNIVRSTMATRSICSLSTRSRLYLSEMSWPPIPTRPTPSTRAMCRPFSSVFLQPRNNVVQERKEGRRRIISGGRLRKIIKDQIPQSTIFMTLASSTYTSPHLIGRPLWTIRHICPSTKTKRQKVFRVVSCV